MKKLKQDLWNLKTEVNNPSTESNVENVENPGGNNLSEDVNRNESDVDPTSNDPTITQNIDSIVDCEILDEDNSTSGGGGDAVKTQVVYFTEFPNLSDHKYHHKGIAAGVAEKLDKRVVNHIKDLVAQGHRKKCVIINSCEWFVKTNIKFGGDLSLRHRFIPKSQKIRNIIKAVKAATQHSKFDQENIAIEKKKWEQSGKVKFIPKGAIEVIEDYLERIEGGDMDIEEEGEWENYNEIITTDPSESKLLFVYQSEKMQRLYQLYGHRLILLDATHKICKYSIPLFFLVVQANVNFQIAGVIVVEDETAELLTKALMTVKVWNPSVKPKYGMIDFDTGELLALEGVFPGIIVFLCDFHREQSWTRWINLRSHNVYSFGKDVLARFRRIAHAWNNTELQSAFADLKNWDKYPGPVQTYFEGTWEPQLKRWCLFYRPNDLFRCNTNNGTERLNKSLKHGELAERRHCSLSELLSVIIEKFLPTLYENYVTLNIQYTSGHKPHNSSFPPFMWNRPGPLVDHMWQRYAIVSEAVAGSVRRMPGTDLSFKVSSFHQKTFEMREYTVNFGDEMTMCSCECTDFKRFRLPCKHFYAVIISKKARFDEITPLFTKDVYTNIDPYVIGEDSELLTAPAFGLVDGGGGDLVMESESTSADSNVNDNLSVPLPGPRKTARSIFKQKKQSLLNLLKVVNQKIHDLKDDDSEVVDELMMVINHANDSLDKCRGNELVLTEEAQCASQPASITVPPRSYKIIENDMQIYNPRLPAHKNRKHPFSGRFGETADMMKAHLNAKVPLPKQKSEESNIVIDGVVDMDNLEVNIAGIDSPDEDDECMEEPVLTNSVNVNNQEIDFLINGDVNTPAPKKKKKEDGVVVKVEVIDEKGRMMNRGS